jgi:hypothetical protein
VSAHCNQSSPPVRNRTRAEPVVSPSRSASY